MAHPLAEIEKILTEELDLYNRLYEIEENKSSAIIEKDGGLMEELCARQEMMLPRVSRLEEARLEQIERYAETLHPVEGAGKISLRDIVAAMDEEGARRLMGTGMELKKAVMRLENLFQANNTMIRDNLEFFDLLLSGLRSSSITSDGYSEKGMDRGKKADALLFNKTV